MDITEKTARELIRELSILKTLLRKENYNEQWVKASQIIRLTGWNKDRMRRARIRGEIKYKKVGNSFWYDYNSLLPVHILSFQKEKSIIADHLNG